MSIEGHEDHSLPLQAVIGIVCQLQQELLGVPWYESWFRYEMASIFQCQPTSLPVTFGPFVGR